ncbi:hypothetical protein L195_g049860, partial [Trifolium pratense]
MSLLGFSSEHHAPPRDEEDQKERSSKKIKGTINESGDQGEGRKVNENEMGSKSYKESVVGVKEVMEGGRVVHEEEMVDEEVVVEGHIEEQ